MFLAFWDFIQIPFGYLLEWLYRLTTSYGWALFLFGIIIRVVMLPATVKSKKSTMKMSRLSPQVQFLQKKYANDQQKQAAALQELYKAEGVSMGAGCLWSLIPLLLIFPLYTIVREPMTYLLHESKEIVAAILEALKGELGKSTFYHQIEAAALINDNPEKYRELLSGLGASADTLKGLNFTFLGAIQLGQIPSINIFGETWRWDWAHVGAALLPILSAGSQVVSMLISQKLNNSLVTNEKGVQDKEAAKKSQSNQQGKIMMWMMPLMSLWIGFTLPAALSLYWISSGVATTVIDIILTKRYRKIYDAEDASRLRKALQEEEAAMERERIRAERRAANPDGITQNTSKKKLQQAKQKEEEAAKAAALKDYNARRGIVEEEEEGDAPLSGIPSRPNCKGRAYRADRYSSQSTEE